MNSVVYNRCLAFIVSILPILWVCGVHVNDMARILAALIPSTAFIFRKKLNKLPLMNSHMGFLLTAACSIFLVADAVYIFSEPILTAYWGTHGIDFAIFSQVVASIARRHGPMTSMVTLGWRNFLAHHFVPFLYIPAAISFFSVPAFISLSLIHGICLIAAGYGFYLICRQSHFDSRIALVFTSILFAAPTVRHGLLFGVHDEVFSLPFLMFAFVAWIKRKFLALAILLLLAATTKESLSFVGLAFLIMVAIEEWRDVGVIGPGDQRLRRFWSQMLPLGLAGFALTALALGYFFLQPIFLGKSFDHFSKLASFSDLASPSVLAIKVGFLGFILAPLLFYPLMLRRNAHLVLPALPLLGIILISGFAEMWKPMNYYGIVPTFLLAAAAAIGLSRAHHGKKIIDQPLILYFMICIAFSWSGKKPIKTIWRAFSTPAVATSELEQISGNAKVIASPTAALFLNHSQIVWRLYSANLTPPHDFDFIVTKAKEDGEELGAALLNRAKICLETESWRIYCP